MKQRGKNNWSPIPTGEYMYRLASPEKSHAGWAILEEFTASSLKTAEKDN